MAANDAVRPLSGNQYRQLLARLEMSQVGMARLLGVNDTTSRRWIMHGVIGAPALVLHLLANGKITIQDLEEVPRD